MDPLTLGLGLAGLGSSLFGQSRTNEMQQQMMQQQQSFQERMSSTAYQRASADMQAAGLNPMMMFSSGSAASSPAGASPSPNVKSGLNEDLLNKAVSTATQAKVANATIDNLVQQNAKIKAETLTEHVRPGLVAEQAGQARSASLRNVADTKRVYTAMPIVHNEAITDGNEASIDKDVRRAADIAGFAGKRADTILSPVSSIVSTAKGVRSLRPQRSTVERASDGKGNSFEERFHY